MEAKGRMRLLKYIGESEDCVSSTHFNLINGMTYLDITDELEGKIIARTPSEFESVRVLSNDRSNKKIRCLSESCVYRNFRELTEEEGE